MWVGSAHVEGVARVVAEGSGLCPEDSGRESLLLWAGALTELG